MPKQTKQERPTRIDGMFSVKMMPRINKIRLGDRLGKNGAPRNTAWFVVSKDVEKEYGKQPTILDVSLPDVHVDGEADMVGEELFHAKLAKVFPYAMRRYATTKAGHNKLICEGNMDTAFELDFNTGLRMERKCPCSYAEEQNGRRPACGPQGNLFVMLYRVQWGGVYQVDIKSKISMQGIIDTCRYAFDAFGRFWLMPMTLEKEIRQITKPDGKAVKMPIVVLRLNVTPDKANMLLNASGDKTQVLLPPPQKSERIPDVLDLDERPSQYTVPRETIKDVEVKVGDEAKKAVVLATDTVNPDAPIDDYSQAQLDFNSMEKPPLPDDKFPAETEKQPSKDPRISLIEHIVRSLKANGKTMTDFNRAFATNGKATILRADESLLKEYLSLSESDF